MDRKEILDNYYSEWNEDDRLLSRFGQVEFLTTIRYIEKYLEPGMRILEVGAGTGRYSHYFARKGYKVDVGCVTLYQKDDEGKTTRTTLEVDFVCNRGSERVYIQSAYSLPDEDKQKQEQRSLTLTDDSFTKIIITRDDIPTHTMPNGIIMMNVFDYLLN